MAAAIIVRYWAGAARAAGRRTETLTVSTLGELRATLTQRGELTKVCAVASFLVDGQRADDAVLLRDGAEIDVLPPFAGG